MKTCCFIGHRKISLSENAIQKLKSVIKNLINDDVTTFLFGSRSEFDNLCLGVVTDLKKKHPHLVRIYVRAEFEYINQAYEEYLLESYDKTYFSKEAKNNGRLTYVLRNQELINKSDICFFYYNPNYHLQSKCKQSKASGTKLAFEYAIKKQKEIINIFENE